eukprot:scaffold152_cov383-Prasinococcus_capsulatus_cf.AAC.10
MRQPGRQRCIAWLSRGCRHWRDHEEKEDSKAGGSILYDALSCSEDMTSSARHGGVIYDSTPSGPACAPAVVARSRPPCKQEVQSDGSRHDVRCCAPPPASAKARADKLMTFPCRRRSRLYDVDPVPDSGPPDG